MTNVRTPAKSISLAGCYMKLPFTQLHLSIYNLVHPDSQQQNLQALHSVDFAREPWAKLFWGTILD